MVGEREPPNMKTHHIHARFWGLWDHWAVVVVRQVERAHNKCKHSFSGVGGIVTPEIECEHLISRILRVVNGSGSGTGPEKAHNLQKQAQMLNFGACGIVD